MKRTEKRKENFAETPRDGSARRNFPRKKLSRFFPELDQL
jgi:hypothetical protein